MTENNKARVGILCRVTWIGSIVNLVLAAGKLAAGILGRSGAMVADAVHSISDLATDLVVLAFVRISARPKDESHDYGHGKFETLATVIVGLALFAVAVGIFVDSVQKIVEVLHGQVIARPGMVALIAAAVSIVAKEALYRYTVRVGRRYDSPAVVANAWHHRSDALSSIGTLVGIGGAYFLGEKWRLLDPLAAIVVAALIVKVSYDLVASGLNELLEKSLPREIEEKILAIVTEDPHVCDPHNLKTRRIGSSIAVEVHVRMNAEMSVRESHAITKEIERKLKEAFGPATQAIIHVEPLDS